MDYNLRYSDRRNPLQSLPPKPPLIKDLSQQREKHLLMDDRLAKSAS